MEPSRQGQKLHLVYATDEPYLFYVQVSLCSAANLASRPEDLVAHILDCGISDAAWEAFAGHLRSIAPAVEVHRHPIDISQFEAFRTWRYSRGAYGRLCLGELLPETEWCLYADGDTLFLGDPLEVIPLFDPDKYIQGQQDTVIPLMNASWFKEHNVPLDPPSYICSGFVIMNLRAFREHRLFDRCIEALKAYPTLPCPDQDALNLACAGHIGLLPLRWGTLGGKIFGPGPQGCVHLAGRKPWEPCFGKFGYSDANAVWVHYVRETFGKTLKDATGLSWPRWIAYRLYTRLIGLALCTLARIPAMGRRYPWIPLHYCHWSTRGWLTKRWWER